MSNMSKKYKTLNGMSGVIYATELYHFIKGDFTQTKVNNWYEVFNTYRWDNYPYDLKKILA